MDNGIDKSAGEPYSHPVHTTRSRRRKALRIASATGLAIGLTAGVTAIAGAATGSGSNQSHPAPPDGISGNRIPPNGGSPPVAFGTVATVGTDSFTLTTKGGTTVTVDVTSSTTYNDQGVTSPTLANVTVGETVAAFGTEASRTITATSVDIGTPGGGPGRFGGSPPAAFGTGAGTRPGGPGGQY